LEEQVGWVRSVPPNRRDRSSPLPCTSRGKPQQQRRRPARGSAQCAAAAPSVERRQERGSSTKAEHAAPELATHAAATLGGDAQEPARSSTGHWQLKRPAGPATEYNKEGEKGKMCLCSEPQHTPYLYILPTPIF